MNNRKFQAARDRLIRRSIRRERLLSVGHWALGFSMMRIVGLIIAFVEAQHARDEGEWNRLIREKKDSEARTLGA